VYHGKDRGARSGGTKGGKGKDQASDLKGARLNSPLRTAKRKVDKGAFNEQCRVYISGNSGRWKWRSGQRPERARSNPRRPAAASGPAAGSSGTRNK